MPAKVSVVIPARLGSTRLPRKVLLDIAGKPMLQRVWEQAGKMARASEVLIATDSDEVLKAAQSWGAHAVMTSPDCASGTERIASIIGDLAGDFVINVQGDEPFIPPELLDSLVAAWEQHGDDLVTATYPITDPEELTNPNRVKVVRAHQGRALYFTRSTAPYIRGVEPAQWHTQGLHWVHIGVYGYARPVLEDYAALPPSPLEQAERLEQLRFIEAGLSIHCIETAYRPLGVDTAEDLAKANLAAQA